MSQTISLNKHRMICRLFIAVVAFNIFLQFDIAEDLFNSFFDPREIAGNSSPICGSVHQFANHAPSDRYIVKASVSGFSSGQKKTNKYSTVRTSLSDIIFASNNFYPDDVNIMFSEYVVFYSGLSPPIS